MFADEGIRVKYIHYAVWFYIYMIDFIIGTLKTIGEIWS